MDKHIEVAGSNSFLRLASRAVASATLLTMGLFAVPAWATCAFSAPTERASTAADGWADGASATSGDLVFVVGAGTGGVTMPAIADEAACDGEGSVEVTLWKDGVQQTVATGESSLTLLSLTDDATTPSSIAVATEGADNNSLVATGAALTYTAASPAGFHNAAPVAFELRAEKAFSGGDVATFSFTVTIQPAALGTAPTDVELYAETATSIYVEFTGDGNDANASLDPATEDTTATAYEIEYTYTPSGTMAMPVTRTMTVMDTATGTDAAGTAGVNPRQSATLTGLAAGATYTISVMGVRGTGYARSESAETTLDEDGTTALRQMTRMPYYNPRQEPDNEMAKPYKISVGETVDLAVKNLIYLGLAGAAADPAMSDQPIADPGNPALDDTEGRGAAGDTPTFNFAVAAGNSTTLRVEYLNDGDGNNADDLLRLTGLMDTDGGQRTVTITATSMDGMTTLRGDMRVQVLENFAPVFAISEATVDWNVSTEGGNDPMAFEINVMENFVSDQISDANTGDCTDENASDDANCDHTLEFSMSFSSWFEIDEETGVISVKDTVESLEAVREGDQYELTVTATDQNDASDTMTIFVDAVGEENDAPKRRARQSDVFLQPLTEANGGGYRMARNLRSQFSDEEMDDLCFEIRGSNLTDSDGNTLADASLGGASSCQNDSLTITMRLPSTDPEDDDFGLLGKYGKETVSVEVGAYERGSTPRVSTEGVVTVSVHLVYGANEGPDIRSVAQVTGQDLHVVSGGHEIDEGADIRLTFTADDAQPGDDELCWSPEGRCMPCTGNPQESSTRDSAGNTIHRRTSNRVINGVSHEYDVIIPGTMRSRWDPTNVTQVTDFERYNGVYTVRLCATDLAGESHRISFDVMLRDVEEMPELDDIDPLFMVVGDFSSDVDLSDYASDGDGKSDIVSYDANCIISCQGALSFELQDSVVRITPSSTQLGDADVDDVVEVEIEASVTDSSGQTAYQTFIVTVKDRNTMPQFDGGLAAVSYTVKENSGVGTSVGEPLAVSDVDDGDRLSVKVFGSDNFSAGIVRTSPTDAEPEDVTYGVQIRVAKAGMDFESDRNQFDITVQIEDNYGGRDAIDAHISLTDINESPELEGDDIEDMMILDGLTRCVVDASEHFSDPDNRDQQAGLLIDASSTRPADVGVSIVDNNMVCITGRNVGTGPARIKVTATDREDLQVSKSFRVSVEPNMPPMLVGDGIPDAETQEGGNTGDMDLSMYFDDGDMLYDEVLTYSFTMDDPGDIATGALVGDQTMLRIYGDNKGLVDVTVTATDEKGQSVSSTFEVQVIRNYAPTVDMEAIAMQEQYIGKEYDPIDATQVFMDEGDTLDYSITTSNPDIATTAIKYDEMGGPWIVVHLHSPGTVDVTMTATDSAQQSASITFTLIVHPRNDPPMLAMPIGDMELIELRSLNIDLGPVFTDDYDMIDIVVVNEDETIADVVHRMTTNMIRVYGNEPGETTVVVTATDDIGQSVADTFVVTVVENHPPVVANKVEKTYLFVYRSIEVDLSETFSDANDDPLVLTAESANDDVATVSLDGTTLTINGISVGQTSVLLTATDPGELTVQHVFDVEVESDSPFVVEGMEIADQMLTVVEPITVSFEGLFGDPEDDELTYMAVSDDEEVATVMIEGTDLIITGVMVGETMVTLTASDPYDNSAYVMFGVEVVNAMAMVVNEIPDQTMTVVEPLMISIADTFSDPDGDELTYMVMSSNEDAATAMLDGTDLTITAVKVGMTTVTVTATDPGGLSAETSFDVTVENAAPMLVNKIADQTMTVVEPIMISIADTFMDPDGDELTYMATSSNEAAATVTVEMGDAQSHPGAYLMVTAVKVGMTTITVKAMDPDGLYAMDMFDVEVENAAPMLVTEIADVTMTVVDPVMISIADTFMDPDGDELTYMATSSNEAAATVSVEMGDAQSHPGPYLMITAVKVGMTTITVTAMDPGGLYAMDMFEVDVINAAPMLVSEIDDQKLTVVEPIMISVADNFMDPDGDPLTFTAMSSNEAAATVRVNDADITITAVKVGFTNVTVTASDPDGLSVSDTFEVEVENAAPMMVGTLDDQVVTRGEPLTFSISGVFMDPDGDPLTNTAGSADSSIATATVSGESVTLDGHAPGTTTITITASDPDGLSASGSFSVRVETIPEAVGTIADITIQIGGPSVDMNIAQYFEDDDGDTLSYVVAVTGNAATASLSGADLTVAPHTRGSSTITLTASDPKGRSATQSFTATVSDSELRDVAGMALAHHGRAVLSSVSAVLDARLESDRMDTGLFFSRFSEYLPSDEALLPAYVTAESLMRSEFSQPNFTTSGTGWGSNNSTMQSPIGAPNGESNLPSLDALFNPLTSTNFSQTLNGNGGIGSWSVWGGFDFQNFEGDGYSGEATSLFLGVDVQSHVCWLFGVSIASNTGESDYTWGTATQTMETSLTTILPYVRYQPTDGKSSFWGVFGSGSGEAESTVVNAANQTSDLSLSLGLAGMRYEFAEQGNFNFAFRGDIGFAGIETASGDGAIDSLSADVNRLRAGIEASVNVDPGNGGSVVPFGELAVRNDGGDGVTGSGLEVAGGLRFSQDAFSFEARGRLTAAHGGEEFSEQGISVVAAFRPAQDGTGFSMTISPRWGSTSGAQVGRAGQSIVWNETTMIGVSSIVPEANVLQTTYGKSLDTSLGYGFRMNHGRFVFKPYINTSTSATNVKSTLIGAELKQLIQAPRFVNLNFVFGQVEDDFGSERQVGLDVRILF